MSWIGINVLFNSAKKTTFCVLKNGVLTSQIIIREHEVY